MIPQFYPGVGYGRIAGKVSEYDAMLSYLTSLCDSLDDDGLRYQIYDKDEPVMPHTLLIHASIGWFEPGKGQKKCITSNLSSVHYGKSSTTIAKLFSETMSEWGKHYVDYHHRTAEPRLNNKIADLDCPSDEVFTISVSPFIVNAPNAEDYVKFSPILGKMMATCIQEFVAMRKHDGDVKYFGR